MPVAHEGHLRLQNVVGSRDRANGREKSDRLLNRRSSEDKTRLVKLLSGFFDQSDTLA
jgi:hypothetical protein